MMIELITSVESSQPKIKSRQADAVVLFKSKDFLDTGQLSWLLGT